MYIFIVMLLCGYIVYIYKYYLYIYMKKTYKLYKSFLIYYQNKYLILDRI